MTSPCIPSVELSARISAEFRPLQYLVFWAHAVPSHWKSDKPPSGSHLGHQHGRHLQTSRIRKTQPRAAVRKLGVRLHLLCGVGVSSEIRAPSAGPHPNPKNTRFTCRSEKTRGSRERERERERERGEGEGGRGRACAQAPVDDGAHGAGHLR
ncbi:hypothetical protein AOLI_G00164290 [Acnodon oligacanthus]